MHTKRRDIRRPRLRLECLETRRVLAAGISLEVTTNGIDAEAAPGPEVEIESVVEWRYRVSNTGDVPVRDPVVTDDAGTPDDPSDDLLPQPVNQPPLQAPPRGTLEATYEGLFARHFVVHPFEPYLYASLTQDNSIAIINTDTLALEDVVHIGSGPLGMALSTDGTRLYVANSTSNRIGILDTETREALPSIHVAEPPSYVEVGADGRLYVLGTDSLMQVDPETGQSVGPNIGPWYMVRRGFLAISPDRDRLYYADDGRSPASFYQFDVSVDPPAQLWTNPSDVTRGSNGNDLTISHDGTFISYASGYGQMGYRIAKYDTDDMRIEGTFNTGAYPREITFSPDDAVAYTVHTSGLIDVWDTESFLSLGAISTMDEAHELKVDRGGRRIFAAFEDELRVFGTGRHVDYNVGDTDTNGLLDPGESWTYASSGIASAGSYMNDAVATAIDPLEGTVSHGASSYHLGVGALIRLETLVDDDRADDAPGPLVPVGEPVPLSYVVSNPGSFPLGDVELVDDNGSSEDPDDDLYLDPIRGDDDGDGILDPGETWHYETSVTSVRNQVSRVATVTARPLDETGVPLPDHVAVADHDAGNHFGVESAIHFELTTNGRDAEEPTGPGIVVGEQVTWNYQVTNVGNAPLPAVTVTDDNGTLEDNDDFSPVHVVHESYPGQNPPATVERVFDGLNASQIVAHPFEPQVYVSLPERNSVAIIDTNTLQLLDTVFIGPVPRGMAFSADGTTLYVANQTSHRLGVLNTITRETPTQLMLDDVPIDVKVGSDGRLFVLGNERLMQISPDTGESVGPDIGRRIVTGGELAINARRDRLYYGDHGRSPASLYQFDVSVDPPRQLWESPHDSDLSGSYGDDLALSHDGSFVSYTTGSGQLGYQIAKYDTADMSIEGTFDTGRFPRRITFSPDDDIAYAVHTSGHIDLYDTGTFESLGTFPTSGEATEVFVDRTGRYLFAAFEDELRVYNTGRVSSLINVGDSNLNGLLDPGETWTYSSSGIASPGQHARAARVVVADSVGRQLNAEDTSHYIGGEGVIVQENVSGGVVAAVEEPDEPYSLSDDRFEIVDGNLRLVEGGYVSHASDDAGAVAVLSNDPAPQLLQAFVLNVTPNPFPWHNADSPFDVNDDGQNEPSDVLAVINELNRGRIEDWRHRPAGFRWFYDTSADGDVTPLDALRGVNYLNRLSASGEGERLGASPASMLMITVKAEDFTDVDESRERSSANVEQVGEERQFRHPGSWNTEPARRRILESNAALSARDASRRNGATVDAVLGSDEFWIELGFD